MTKTKLKPYLGYNKKNIYNERPDTILIFALCKKHAEIICCIEAPWEWDNIRDVRVELIENQPWIYDNADEENLKNDFSHVIQSDNVITCNNCHTWGHKEPYIICPHPDTDGKVCRDCCDACDFSDFDVEKKELFCNYQIGLKGDEKE